MLHLARITTTNLMSALCYFVTFNCGTHCVKSAQIRSFFWFVFSCIRTEYGDLQSKSPYTVRIQENADQKKCVFGHFSRSNSLIVEIKANSMVSIFKNSLQQFASLRFYYCTCRWYFVFLSTKLYFISINSNSKCEF